MTPKDIKIALIKAEKKQADIARDIGVSKVSIHNVVHGISRSRRIELAIARAIHKSPADVWPQWYSQKRVA